MLPFLLRSRKLQRLFVFFLTRRSKFFQERHECKVTFWKALTTLKAGVTFPPPFLPYWGGHLEREEKKQPYRHHIASLQ